MRRFLALCGFAHQFARHCDEVYLSSVIKIQVTICSPLCVVEAVESSDSAFVAWQGLFRGYRLRIKIYRIVSRLQLHAVVQIQSLIRYDYDLALARIQMDWNSSVAIALTTCAAGSKRVNASASFALSEVASGAGNWARKSSSTLCPVERLRRRP